MRTIKAQDNEEWQDDGEDYEEDDNYEPQTKRRYAKKRTLQRWNVDQDQYLLLALVELCAATGIDLPWAQVGEVLDPVVSAESIKQHIAKIRTAREKNNFACPPRYEPRRVVKKTPVILRQRTGTSLLPPATQARSGRRRRRNSSIEREQEPVKKRPVARRDSSAGVEQQPQRQLVVRVDELSGYEVGSAEHNDFLCKEADSFAALTRANMPMETDFMGNKYAFKFDPQMYPGTCREIHQQIINDGAERSEKAGDYPGDDEVMAAATKVGLGGGTETSFAIKRLRFPFGERAGVQKHSPVIDLTGPAPTLSMHQAGASTFQVPTAPMHSAAQGRFNPSTSVSQTHVASFSNIYPSDVHFGAPERLPYNDAVPRSGSWSADLNGGQQMLGNAVGDSFGSNDWSPYDNYTTSKLSSNGSQQLDSSLGSGSSSAYTKADVDSAWYGGNTGLSTPYYDSLNASQIVSPLHEPAMINNAFMGHAGGAGPSTFDGLSDLVDPGLTFSFNAVDSMLDEAGPDSVTEPSGVSYFHGGGHDGGPGDVMQLASGEPHFGTFSSAGIEESFAL